MREISRFNFENDWCASPFRILLWTDFREDDPAITGQGRKISILEHSPSRFIMSVRYKNRGREMTAARIVSLEPPDAWHLDWIGDEHNESADYKLIRIGNARKRARATITVTNKTGTLNPADFLNDTGVCGTES